MAELCGWPYLGQERREVVHNVGVGVVVDGEQVPLRGRVVRQAADQPSVQRFLGLVVGDLPGVLPPCLQLARAGADAPEPADPVTAAEADSDPAAPLAIITRLLRRFPAVIRELGMRQHDPRGYDPCPRAWPPDADRITL